MNSDIMLQTEAPGSPLGGFARETTAVVITQRNRTKPAGPAASSLPRDFKAIKARQKATWESGDFGEVAKTIISCAEEFMARLPLRPGIPLT